MIRILFGLILFSAFPILSSGQLTIIVDNIPDNTPEGDPIHIAGNFQGWNPSSRAHVLDMDTTFQYYYITLPAGTGDIEFKFTRGSWEKVESDENGNYIPNRFYSPSDNDTLTVQILGWEDLDGNGGGISTAAENVHIITDSFPIPQLDRYRRVWIYLPPDYETSDAKYPVLYMHDGQNVFDNLTSYLGEWEVDETLNSLYEKGDPGIIVVAVDNGRNLRTDEYSPWENSQYGAGGQGDLYVRFLVENLKPFIDENYRTLRDRGNTGIMGSSLGGLISIYAGVKYQEVFGKVGAFSPAYWFNKEIFQYVAASGKSEEIRIYQIAGTNEGQNYINNMFAMEDTLLSAGFSRNEILTIEENDGEHSEWFWAREFEDAYLWLFRNGSSYIDEVYLEPYKVNLYPNPAGDVFILDFDIQTPQEISVEIISGNGSVKKTLYSQTLEAGGHSLRFDLTKRNFPPGMYMCRFQTAEYSKTLKFVISH